MASLRTWLRPPRKFQVTREGKWFIGGTLLLGFAAVNGGINLLFLLFGTLLWLLVGNGILAEASMRKLQAKRRPPPTLFAGKPFLMSIAVKNPKQVVSTFSLEAEDLSGDGTPVDRRCFFLKIPAGREQEATYRRILYHRGLHRLSGIRLSTRFPFGLLRRSLDLAQPHDLLVYPELLPLENTWLKEGLSLIGERGSPKRAREGEFHGLRELRPDDDPKDIHHPTSARHGRPFVREFEAGKECPVVVTLENAPAPISDAALEQAVSLAASLCLAFLRRGFQVGLAAGATWIPEGMGGMQETRLLRALALYQPAPSPPKRPLSHATLLCITPSFHRPIVERRVPSYRRKSA